MPLNIMQKRMIIATIDHLLDFPNELAKNNLAEKALIAIFTDKPVDTANKIDDQETYLLLRNYIEHPQDYFQRITSVSTETFTTGELQQYLLDLIVHRLKTAPNKKSQDENITNKEPIPDETEIHLDEGMINPFQVGEGEVYLRALQAKSEWNNLFIPTVVPTPTNEDDIYQLSGLEGAIYSGRIDFELEEQKAFFKDNNGEMCPMTVQFYVPMLLIDISLSPTEISKRKLYFREPILAAQVLDEDEFDELMENAENVARSFAANSAMFYLTEKGILSFDQTRLRFADAVIISDSESSDSSINVEDQPEQLKPNIEEEVNSQVYELFPSEDTGENSSDVTEEVKDNEQMPLYLLITNKYYYQQIRQKKQKLFDFENIPFEVAEYLVDPAIIKLLQECDFDFTVLSWLPVSELNRLTHPNLFPLFKKKIFSLDQICFMAQSEFSFVTYPVYNRLLQDKEIKPYHVWKMNKERIAILAISFIANLIQQHKIAFKDALLLPVKLTRVFSNQHYAEYFNKHPDLLLLTCVFSSNKCKLLIEIMDLVIEDQVTLEEIRGTKDWHIGIILNNDHIIPWIKEKIIRFADIKSIKNREDFFDFYCLAFTKKLFKLIGLAKPEDEESTKKITGLLSQFPFVCDSKELESSFRERVLHHCVFLVQNKMLKMRAQYFIFPDIRANIQKILDEIMEIKFSKKQDWSGTLKSITDQSQDLLNTILNLKEETIAKTTNPYSYLLFFNQLPKVKNKTDRMNMFLFNLGRFHELIDPQAAKAPSPIVLRTLCE